MFYTSLNKQSNKYVIYDVTTTVLDIIHRPAFYLKHDGCSYLTGNTLRLRCEHNSFMRSIGL
jgi:hypothetical protein